MRLFNRFPGFTRNPASAVILYWTVLFTAAIAAFIVMVTKGPAYVTDAYPLS